MTDLAAHTGDCTLAIWHHPRFSAAAHGLSPEVAPFWNALYDHGAELLLNGHEHHYERVAPQGPSGRADADGPARSWSALAARRCVRSAPPRLSARSAEATPTASSS